MFDEPRKHPRFLMLMALAAIGTVPLPFVGAQPAWFLGLPLWLVWSLGFTVALSAITSWGLLRFWRDDEDPDTLGEPQDGREDGA